ncbi:MAG: UDP-N-acetylglucosamine 2-epimerase (non-hydrolyzing) [Rhodospirillales bacterium]|nr:UDP-N-acetylglucosamine 2-epimerase (non-hydrolyzing) [Rhodospirillales bacterium]
MKLHLVVGARPNFMKVAPLWHELKKATEIVPVLIHTGQHYSENMSQAILNDLNLPEPDFHLGVGGGSHAQQTARIMLAYENVCGISPPDCLLVVGDVNSTLATALVAKKMNVPVVHLEAGLRSFDRSMPEEINRLVTDAISDLLLTPSPDADENLFNEGVAKSKVVRIGNIMIDSFEMLRNKIDSAQIYLEYGLREGDYCVVTLHRPSNVDDHSKLEAIVQSLEKLSNKYKICFPVHPRTGKVLEEFGYNSRLIDSGIKLIEPMSYIKFMSLVKSCRFIITDSGGIQEETSYLGIDCFTLRDNTERPITISEGTNRLISAGNLLKEVAGLVQRSDRGAARQIDMWDGATALRAVGALREFWKNRS